VDNNLDAEARLPSTAGSELYASRSYPYQRDPKQVDGVIHGLSFRLSSAEIGEIEAAAANPKQQRASIA
jgi:hypothetical protein